MAEQVQNGESRIPRKLKVLVVESEVGSRERMQQALEGDFLVQCVSSLPEAWEMMETHPPDILIAEVVVSKESGLELCRMVRRHAMLNHLPVMLLTTLATISDKVAGYEAGADDYVIKPCDTRHLLARIHFLARIKRLEQSES